MRAFILCLFECIALLQYSRAQQIKFELYLHDNCADTVRKALLYVLTQGDLVYTTNNNGVIYLSKTGNYELSAIESSATSVYQFSAFKSFRDTVNSKMIEPCLEPTSSPSFIGYCCCQQKCEGLQIDYYKNGNKRIEGYFKEGIPKGQVKIYYPSGRIKQLDTYNKKGILKTRKIYDERGNLKSPESY